MVVIEGPFLFVLLFTVHNGMPDRKKGYSEVSYGSP
jgi:hypothetical protein